MFFRDHQCRAEFSLAMSFFQAVVFFLYRGCFLWVGWCRSCYIKWCGICDRPHGCASCGTMSVECDTGFCEQSSCSDIALYNGLSLELQQGFDVEVSFHGAMYFCLQAGYIANDHAGDPQQDCFLAVDISHHCTVDDERFLAEEIPGEACARADESDLVICLF